MEKYSTLKSGSYKSDKNLMNENPASPSKGLVQSILNYSKSLSVQETKYLGKVRVNSN